MRLKLFFLTIIFFCSFFLSAQNREIEFEKGKWQAVLEKAQKENKLIYLDCYTTWCGPCKRMAKYIFTNDTVADFYNKNFVNAKIDMEKGEGIELAKKYGIRAYPTMLYLNSSGEVVHRSCGSAPTTKFISIGKDALNPETRLMTATEKFNKGVNPKIDVASYLGMLDDACQDIQTELGDYFASQKEEELTSRENWEIIYRFVNDYSSKQFRLFEANKPAFEERYTVDSVRSKLNSVYASGLRQAVKNKDSDTFDALKSKVNASGSPDAEKIVMTADLELYKSEGDWDKYIQLLSSYGDKYLEDKAMDLNGIAWLFYEHTDDRALLEKAERWAKRAVELQDIYPTNDTYASILYKLGKKEEAQKAAERAISLAKTNGNNYDETKQLLKKIERLKTPEK
jgi:thioredoxin-related protein